MTYTTVYQQTLCSASDTGKHALESTSRSVSGNLHPVLEPSPPVIKEETTAASLVTGSCLGD